MTHGGLRPTLHRARPTSTRGSGPAGSRCSGAWAGAGCSASSTSGSCWPWRPGFVARPAHPAARRRRRRGRRQPSTPPPTRSSRPPGIAQGDQLIDVDLQAAGERVADAAVGATRPSCTGASTAPWWSTITERTPVAVVGEGADGPARGRRGPGARPGLRRRRSWRRRWSRIDGVGAGLDARRVPRRRRPPTPWPWPLASAARSASGLRARRRRRTARRASSTRASRSRFGDASQLEAKVRSLRTVLDQVDSPARP